MKIFGYQAWGIDGQAKNLIELLIKLAVLVKEGQEKIGFSNFLFVPKGENLINHLNLQKKWLNIF